MSNPLIKFKTPINLGLGLLIEKERAWGIIRANDKLLRAGKITREEWFRRRDALAAEIKTKAE